MNNVTQRSVELRSLAGQYVEELSRHQVLAGYWDRVALVLKGSVARGNADHLSDLDFVLFCEEDVRQAIVADYYRAGLTARQDGVFLPLGEWVGHYHFESFDHLREHFAQRHFPHIWEFRVAIPLHDPRHQFENIMTAGLSRLFCDPLVDVRAAYLDLQLTLDWLRHPLKRGDVVSALLHCGRLIQGMCQLSYLLDAEPYPHDKWLFYYLPTTHFGQAHSADILRYVDTVAENRIPRLDLPLDEYPQYREANALIGAIGQAIREGYGDQPWLGEWYLYV
jgi:hypothetical protein